jgi:hypothetical protein
MKLFCHAEDVYFVYFMVSRGLTEILVENAKPRPVLKGFGDTTRF